MLDFKPYLHERMIAEHPNGFYVIKPAQELEIVPLDCPVCGFFFRTIDDDRAYHEFKCCDFCARNWAAPNRFKWLEGWRPTPEEVEAQNRPPLAFSLR